MARLLLVVAVAFAAPGLASAATPRHDFVVGTGYFDALQYVVTVNAHSGPLGEDPHGSFHAMQRHTSDFNLGGSVTCLHVVGNSAYVGGIIERAPETGEPFEGETFLIQVQDNGEPGRGDLFDAAFTFGQDPPFVPCEPLPFASFGVPAEHGNFVVHDAPAE